MHYIHQMFSMEVASCEEVKRLNSKHFVKMGSPNKSTCSLEEAYFAGERKVFEIIETLIRHSKHPKKLSAKTLGRILFLLACLCHAVQDRKHLAGNPEGINSLEHFLPPAWTHVVTDIDPPRKMEDRARLQTEALIYRLRAFLWQQFEGRPGKHLFNQIQNFKLPPGKELKDFYPSKKFIEKALPQFHPAAPDATAIG